MKNKKVIILSSVAAVVVIGVVLSLALDWPVDTDRSSGDIGKSVRYSQKVETEKLSNMEELLRTDTAYRQDIANAYVVMHTRAMQFDALVELSNKTAGGIDEFAGLLKEMNAMRATVTNTCAQLNKAGNDLEAALLGEKRPDLEQNVINASLAYTTLQKQNRLADRFIETADNYLKKNKASDELKLVRDGWMEYQQMTAALEGDTEAAKHLEELGYQLTEEQTLAYIRDNEVLGIRTPILLGMGYPVFHNSDEMLGIRMPLELEMRDPAFHNTDEVLGIKKPDIEVMDKEELGIRAPLFLRKGEHIIYNGGESLIVINDIISATAQGLKIIVIKRL